MSKPTAVVNHIYQAPRPFLADEPAMSGQDWESFTGRVNAYLFMSPAETIIASKDWEPGTTATRFTFVDGAVRETAVRVNITYTVEGQADAPRATPEMCWVCEVAPATHHNKTTGYEVCAKCNGAPAVEDLAGTSCDQIVFRPFTREDWQGYNGATSWPAGQEPLIHWGEVLRADDEPLGFSVIADAEGVQIQVCNAADTMFILTAKLSPAEAVLEGTRAARQFLETCEGPANYERIG